MGETIFIIPARGGSKRLPGKNILPLAGKPLIQWTIEAAMGSGVSGRVCVSTDDDAIAAAGRAAGAEVPFMRPPELASDTASSMDVVGHALDFFRAEEGREFETVILLQPTSPLRDSRDIAAAYAEYTEKRANAVVSVCRMSHSPLWANVLPPDLSLDAFIRPEVVGRRSQDLPPYYRLNGAIYISSVTGFRECGSLFPREGGFAFVMSEDHSIDIDTLTDLRIAEAILSARQNDERGNDESE